MPARILKSVIEPARQRCDMRSPGLAIEKQKGSGSLHCPSVTQLFVRQTTPTDLSPCAYLPLFLILSVCCADPVSPPPSVTVNVTVTEKFPFELYA